MTKCNKKKSHKQNRKSGCINIALVQAGYSYKGVSI